MTYNPYKIKREEPVWVQQGDPAYREALFLARDLARDERYRASAADPRGNTFAGSILSCASRLGRLSQSQISSLEEQFESVENSRLLREDSQLAEEACSLLSDIVEFAKPYARGRSLGGSIASLAKSISEIRNPKKFWGMTQLGRTENLFRYFEDAIPESESEKTEILKGRLQDLSTRVSAYFTQDQN